MKPELRCREADRGDDPAAKVADGGCHRHQPGLPLLVGERVATRSSGDEAFPGLLDVLWPAGVLPPKRRVGKQATEIAARVIDQEGVPGRGAGGWDGDRPS